LNRVGLVSFPLWESRGNLTRDSPTNRRKE